MPMVVDLYHLAHVLYNAHARDLRAWAVVPRPQTTEIDASDFVNSPASHSPPPTPAGHPDRPHTHA